MLASMSRIPGIASLLAVSLAGCTPLSVKTSPLALEGLAVLDETPFTLYAEVSFRLIELPVGQEMSAFWSDFREKAADNPKTMAISRVADDRILRVVFNEDGVTYAFHFAIYQERRASGSMAIRLLPISAWKPSFGGGSGVTSLRADDAHLLMGQLKASLVANAALVI